MLAGFSRLVADTSRTQSNTLESNTVARGSFAVTQRHQHKTPDKPVCTLPFLPGDVVVPFPTQAPSSDKAAAASAHKVTYVMSGDLI